MWSRCWCCVRVVFSFLALALALELELDRERSEGNGRVTYVGKGMEGSGLW